MDATLLKMCVEEGGASEKLVPIAWYYIYKIMSMSPIKLKFKEALISSKINALVQIWTVKPEW